MNLTPTSRSELRIFAKAPRIGEVKTRLAAAIGADQACEAYRQMLNELARRLTDITDATICFSPHDGDAYLRPFFPSHWRFQPQVGADLGDRLQHAFETAFTDGAERVVIIGSDCPYLSSDDIRQAWRKLDEYEIVFGPAEDGGYWLIGARASYPELFKDIHWGTNTVLEESLQRTHNLGLTIASLRTLSDVDTVEDWLAYRKQLGSGLQR